MVVNISSDVLEKIDKYVDVLTDYPITTSRAHEKTDKMIDALTKLGSSIAVPPICTNKDLGQILDAKGKPMDNNLRRFNYKDKSDFQWAFACYYNEEADTITITKMVATNYIKESIETILQPILEFADRLSAIR